MVITAFLTREKTIGIFLFFEIIIIVIAYIVATYIANMYELILTKLPFKDIFIDYLNSSSYFVLHLPLYTVIIGALIIIIAYAGIPKTREEEVAGF